MSITDELREYAKKLDASASMRSEHGFSPVAMKLTAIADRIDEQHRKALEKVAAMVDEPDEIERRIKALEHLTEGMLLEESEMEERIAVIERKISHRGER